MNEHIFKELYLAKFMILNNYMSEQEYQDRLVDYNLLIIEYSLKLGHQSFKQSILYYVNETKKRNIHVKDKISYLSKCLEHTLTKRENGYY